VKRFRLGILTGVAIAGVAWSLIEWGRPTHGKAEPKPAAIGPIADPGANSKGHDLDPALAAARIRELEAIVEDQAAKLAALATDNEQLRRTPVQQPAVQTPPSEKLEEEKDAEGHVLARGRTRSGVRTGPWEFWWPNGQKQKEGSYVDGKKSGRWTTWSEDGSDEGHGRYVDDLQEGVWTFRDKKGSYNEFEYHLGEVKQ